MSEHAIHEVARRIKSATTFAAVFGPMPSGDTITKRTKLRKEFNYLAKAVHPDLAPPSLAIEAAETFKLLNELRHAAEDAIVQNRYDEPMQNNPGSPAEADGSELVSPSGVYRLKEKVFRTGDFSIFYRGRLLGEHGKPILAKVARDPAQNQWLEREAILLKKVNEEKSNPLAGISRFMPKLLDTFLVTGERNTRYRANIFSIAPDMVSITEIMTAYPRGLEAPQAAWVARRIIAQTLAASMLGVTHTAITPDHVLVEPFTHEPLHIGWPHALEKGRITHVIDRWKDIYPKEVFAKKDADHRTDIYMAGATIVKMMGGDVPAKMLPKTVPEKVARLILRCLEESPSRRPQDARVLLDEFTTAVRNEWGRVYRPLTMPIRN